MKEDREDLIIPLPGEFLCEPSHTRALRKKYTFSCLRPGRQCWWSQQPGNLRNPRLGNKNQRRWL